MVTARTIAFRQPSVNVDGAPEGIFETRKPEGQWVIEGWKVTDIVLLRRIADAFIERRAQEFIQSYVYGVLLEERTEEEMIAGLRRLKAEERARLAVEDANFVLGLGEGNKTETEEHVAVAPI